MKTKTESSVAQNSLVLTKEQLFRGVHRLAPRVAVFDCDGTLWAGDAGSAFMRWSMETGLLSHSASDWLNERYAGYKRGDVSELAICGEMVQVYRGLAEDALREAAARFFVEHIEPNIFPEMLELVDQLHGAGTQIWAVSSTCDWVIEEGVRRFKIAPSHVLAACVACEDGRASDRLMHVPTDEGKVTALERAGITAPDAVFGNSVHDAAMLSVARRAFPINPSPELAARSAGEGWAVYYPASIRPQ